jgi:hypothetical protein
MSYCAGPGINHKPSSYNLDALSITVDQLFDPRLENERFDTLTKLVDRIRSYTKEAGFGLVVINGSITQCPNSTSQTNPTMLITPVNTKGGLYNNRIAKCSKGVSK